MESRFQQPLTREQQNDRFVKLKRSLSYYKRCYEKQVKFMYRRMYEVPDYFNTHEFFNNMHKLNRIRDSYNFLLKR